MRKLDVVDADGHILEPADLWVRELPAKDKARAMRIVYDKEKDGEGLWVEDRCILQAPSAGFIGAARSTQEQRRSQGRGLRYDTFSPRAALFPKERVEELDREGIDLAVLYPSIGLFFAGIRDPQLADATCRIYNDWLAEYCRYAPDRLVGAAALPMQDPKAAAREAERAIGDLGMRGVFLRPNTINDYFLHSPEYDALWGVLQEAGVPVGLHPAGADAACWGAPQFYQRWGRIPGMYKPMVFLFDNYCAFSTMVGYGILERFPRLKVLILESGSGWLLHWLDQMDHWREVKPHEGQPLKPSEYFARQCYISADPDERALPLVAETIGDDKIVWASDYPHIDVTAPSVVAELREHLASLPKRTQKKILGTNAVNIYGLN